MSQTVYLLGYYAVGNNFNQNTQFANGSIVVYYAGTSTPLTTYTDNTGSTPNPNPIPLNQYGQPVTNSGALTQIWVVPGVSAHIQVWSGPNGSGTKLDDQDNIPSIPPSENVSAANTVAISSTTSNNNYPVLLSATGSTGTNQQSPLFATNFTYNPSTEALVLGTTGSISAATLTSTVATGTAPFTVASTTTVANLNAATAANASAVTAAVQSTAGAYPVAFLSGTAGSVSVYTDPGITYDPSTNILSVTATGGGASSQCHWGRRNASATLVSGNINYQNNDGTGELNCTWTSNNYIQLTQAGVYFVSAAAMFQLNPGAAGINILLNGSPTGIQAYTSNGNNDGSIQAVSVSGIITCTSTSTIAIQVVSQSGSWVTFAGEGTFCGFRIA